MQAVKIKLFQQTANYKVGETYSHRETYPLPPYSTVSGLVHHLTGFTEYHPMKISIMGNSGSKVSDTYTRYEFPKGIGSKTDFEGDRQRWNISLSDKNGKRILAGARSAAHNELLTNINLVIHIIPENQEDIKTIYNAFKNPKEYVSLGRREDLAEIKNVQIVELYQTDLDEDYISQIGGYIPAKFIKTLDLEDNPEFKTGTYFYLNHDYSPEKISSKKYYRKWNKEKAMFKDHIHISEDESIVLDDDKEIVLAV